MKGLDYSGSHPDLTCAARSGYGFVARYIGDADPNPLKYLDAVELAAVRAAGLSVVVVRETSAGFIYSESGAAHAKASRGHCNALGLTGIPIYYALDVDPRGLTAAQKNAVTQFLKDAAAADGGGQNVGLYGAYAAIEQWVGQPYCKWGWQTYAWSGGAISSKAHFRQYRNGQNVCGGTVDLNETYADDFGQWPRPQAPVPPPDNESWFANMERSEFEAGVLSALNKWTVTNRVSSSPSNAGDMIGWTHFHAYFADAFGDDKPVIVASQDAPTTWYAATLRGKWGPVTGEQAEALVAAGLAVYHPTTTTAWRAYMVAAWVLDGIEDIGGASTADA